MVRAGSKEFIEKSDDWPQWPLLPVVNRTEKDEDGGWGPKAGVIHAANLTRIRLVNLFSLTKDVWEKAEQLNFDDVQALVDAGWEPD